jgi:hypothetical protein
MAETSNVIILEGNEELRGSVYPTVASATVLAKGDLISASSGAAIAYAGDPDIFLGVSNESSKNGETKKIKVYIQAVITIGCTAATYEFGDPMEYSSGANGTAWSLVKATTGENAIAWSRQYSASNLTTLEVMVDGYRVGAALADKGLWGTSTNAA